MLNAQHTSYSGKLSDSWSLGVLLFALLFGRYPFHHPVITTHFDKIVRAKFQIPNTKSLSMNVKILIRSLIRFNPKERLLSNEILDHIWLKQVNDQKCLVGPNNEIGNQLKRKHDVDDDDYNDCVVPTKTNN